MKPRVHNAVYCPFCGHHKVISWHMGCYDKPWFVECMKCGARGPLADSEGEAVDIWNVRA